MRPRTSRTAPDPTSVSSRPSGGLPPRAPFGMRTHSRAAVEVPSTSLARAKTRASRRVRSDSVCDSRDSCRLRASVRSFNPSALESSSTDTERCSVALSNAVYGSPTRSKSTSWMSVANSGGLAPREAARFRVCPLIFPWACVTRKAFSPPRNSIINSVWDICVPPCHLAYTSAPNGASQPQVAL